MRVPFVLLAASLHGSGPGDRVPLAPGRDGHLRRVLRRADGDALEVTDGAGRVATAVLAGPDAELTAAPLVVDPPTPSVTVVHALPKGRAFDDVVRGLCELGVSAVRPVVTARSVVRPAPDRARSVGDRLRSVAESACEQARSAHLCAVGDPAPWSVTERYSDGPTLRLLAHPAATTGLSAAVDPGAGWRSLALAIGPEGGFSTEEVEAATAAGWTPVRAGGTVLRTVHAGPVLTAAVLALSGRFG